MENRRSGFGLIEVMIAIVIIAGAAMIVTQFITNQARQQIQVRSSADCEASLAAILAKVKELDNNTQIDSWMPTQGEMTPANNTNFLQERMSLLIANGMDPEGRVLNAVDDNMNGYTGAEIGIANSLNNYQLIYSATNLLAGLFNLPGSTSCAADTLVARDDSNYLSVRVDDLVDESTDIRARIERINLSSGQVVANCNNYSPVPVNGSSIANTNTNEGLRLTLEGSYQDSNGNQRTCRSSASFSPGSDLVAPVATVSITPQPGLVPVTGGVLCGTAGPGSFGVTITSPTPEAGVQLLCRLDYLAGRYDGTAMNRTTGTGWFFCSAPEAALSAVVINGNALGAASVVANANTGTVSFTITNAEEGSYKIHVKAVDVARNESPVVTQSILLDLTRPTFAQAVIAPPHPQGPSSLDIYRFQCNDNTLNSWVPGQVSISNAQIEVSANYIRERYALGAALDPTYGCNNTNVGPIGASWPVNSDGPRTAEFLACDECTIALAATPDRRDALWFLDTANIGMAATGVTLTASRRFSYDAGDNHFNPYILSHDLITNVGLPASTFTSNLFIRNFYTNRNLDSEEILNFPQQLAIDSCQPYGTYQYTVTDGCNRSIVPPATRSMYTNSPGSTGASPGSGIPFNTVYCPTFLNAKIGVGNFNPQACIAPLQSCDTNMIGGYSGERSSVPSCTFYPNQNRSCKYPPCTLPNGVLLEVGQISPAIFYVNSVESCGGSCVPQARSCVWNGTNSVLTGSGTFTSCSVDTCPVCPGGTDTCTSLSQFPDCYTASIGPPVLYCRPQSSCIAPSISCGTCSNGDSAAASPSCYDVDPTPATVCCGPGGAPTCPAGEVECTPGPGDPACPLFPNGDGLYCKLPGACIGNWEWPAAACNPVFPNPCSLGQTQTADSQSQFCASGNCCDVQAPDRACHTGCTASPTCTHNGTHALGAVISTYASSTVACGNTCSTISSECLATGWSVAPGSASTCSVNPCPIDGGWSAWGPCSAACGGGNQSRSCNSPAPQFGGEACVGSSTQTCNSVACPSCAPSGAPAPGFAASAPDDTWCSSVWPSPMEVASGCCSGIALCAQTGQYGGTGCPCVCQ
jgi:prepilin-type N-terminal cleavage/methylation domain-containing protein